MVQNVVFTCTLKNLNFFKGAITCTLNIEKKKCIQTKEVNIVPVLVVPGKYTILAIKSIPVLLQNVPKKY